MLSLDKSIKPAVRHQLLFSQELLSNSDYRNSADGDLQRLAHDVILSDDAAELAVAAICLQLGWAAHTRRPSVTDYFGWLSQRGGSGGSVPGVDYLTELHKTRMNLQNRFILPDPKRWEGVKEATLGFIGTWCGKYLHAHLRKPDLKQPAPKPGTQTAAAKTLRDRNSNTDVRPVSSSAQDEVGQSAPEEDSLARPKDRRRNVRYDCEGTGQTSVAGTWKPVEVRVLNLSLGGCYVETNWPCEVGTRLEVLLRVNGLPFRSMGVVRAVYGSSGLGVEFIGLSALRQRQLQDLLVELEERTLNGAASRGG